MVTDNSVLEHIAKMKIALRDHKDHSWYGASDFWEGLCEKHERLLRLWGFSRFKRSINFEYNQWGVSSFRSPQLWHVVRRLLTNVRIPYIPFLAKSTGLRDANWPTESNPSLAAYRFFVATLWQLARSVDRLGALRMCREPLIGDPLQITYRGDLISQDLAMSCIELNTIAGQIEMSNVRRMCELGAGYGRLAYVAASVFPDMDYHIFDIPPALAISQQYLQSVLGPDKVVQWDEDNNAAVHAPTSRRTIRASLPHVLEEYPDNFFDLVINISSLDEMKPHQIDRYLQLIDRKCKQSVYLKGYAKRSGLDPARPFGVTQFPYPRHWRLLYEREDPTHPLFIERIYCVNSHGTQSA